MTAIAVLDIAATVTLLLSTAPVVSRLHEEEPSTAIAIAAIAGSMTWLILRTWSLV